MYAQVRFSLVTPQEVTGALKATGSTDPDILAAAKDQIAAPYRPLKWFGIWGIVTGTLCCLLVILAFIGVPIIIFGIWALRRSKKNRETIEKAYAEYVGKVTGQPPLVPGDLRAVGLVLLTLMGGAGAASAQVPAEFHGDWVSARATCDAAVRFRVEAAKFTLINGKDTQSFGGIEMAGPSYFGPEYNGIQAVAISEFEGDQPVASARVQDLFGVRRHPVVDGDRPVQLHLLSPANRVVQITSDLPGFWAGSYASVRKDMAGRYPKHPWPEDPAAARPR